MRLFISQDITLECFPRDKYEQRPNHLEHERRYCPTCFETVEGNVEHPYKGSFSDELDYRGLGGYKDIYANEIEMIDKKTDEARDIEKHMYANVLALMAILQLSSHW